MDKKDFKRKFIFVDESGDSGFLENSSKTFSYNIMMLSENDIQFIEKELAYFRFYEEKYKELKEYTKNNEKLISLLQKISEKIMVRSFLFNKEKCKFKDK
jgi:hypothetical protein